MRSLDDYQAAILNATRAGDAEAAAVLRKAAEPLMHAEALKQEAAGMGTGERALANLGAGFDSFVEGVKQVVPGMKGASDAELHEKRQRDQALADSSDTGVGPDWAPTLGKTLQFAGETAPTLAIPGVGVGGKLAQTAVTKALPRASQAAQALARVAGTGATGGGVAGALQPVTSDESRGLNTVLGAAGGLVLPAAGVAYRAGRDALSRVTRAGGTGRAPQVLRQALGDEADNVATAAEYRESERAATQPRSVQRIPETLAEASGSPVAARVESGARRDPATLGPWADFVGEQNARRFGAIEDATREAPWLDARAATRDRVAGPMRERALGEAGQDPWFHVPAVEAAGRVAAGPSSANPAVQRVADYVRGQIGADAKTAITPERLYEVRKVLADKLNGPHVIGDELSAATKGAQRETMALINGIDQALDRASGGQWQQYLNRYQDNSGPVNASRAARDAREVFTDKNMATIGGAPEVTIPRLNAVREAGRSNFDPRQTDFSPRAQRTLSALEDQTVRAGEPARVRKLVGSQGGGSQTSTDIDAALRSLVKGPPGFLGKVADVIVHGTEASDVAMRVELSRLLQNPREAAAAIRAAAQAGRALSPAQQSLLEAASRVAAGGTAGLLSE